MEKKTIRKIKWFWSWQDNKREEWLQQFSHSGWHFESIGMRGLAFNFKKGQPREYTYRLDFRLDSKEKMRDYVEFIKDAGWEHIENYDGWQYFRKAAEKDETVELFTDNDSKVQKYKRLRSQQAVFFPGACALMIFLGTLDKYPVWFAIILVSVLMLLAFSIGISLVGVTLRIKELEHQD